MVILQLPMAANSSDTLHRIRTFVFVLVFVDENDNELVEIL